MSVNAFVCQFCMLMHTRTWTLNIVVNWSVQVAWKKVLMTTNKVIITHHHHHLTMVKLHFGFLNYYCYSSFVSFSHLNNFTFYTHKHTHNLQWSVVYVVEKFSHPVPIALRFEQWLGKCRSHNNIVNVELFLPKCTQNYYLSSYEWGYENYKGLGWQIVANF